MRRNSFPLNVLGVAVTVGILPALTHAATIQVMTEDDAGAGSTCTFRQAVAAINAANVVGTGCSASGAFGTDDTITFLPTLTAIALGDSPNNSVIINSSHNLTIQGNGMGGVNITRPTSATNKFGIIRSINSQCTLSLSGMSISNGYAQSTAGGGGLYATGNIIAENSIISGNSARAPGSGTTHGGGIVASSVSLMSSVVSGNQQLGFGTGGGVYADTVSLIGSSVIDNSAFGSGGGIYATSSVTAAQSVVTGNSGLSGGGIVAAVVSVAESTVSNNVASGYGGGIEGITTVSDSTISGNSAKGGAGINAYTGNITNSTISGNAAVTYGGGVFGTTISLSNSTVTANTISTGQSAGIAIGYSEGVPSLSLVSSIVSQNDTANGKFDIASKRSPTPTGDHNLIGTTTGVILTSLTNSISGNPLLGPLADNGGLTLTHALSPSSPAIHTGANPQSLVTDQRGTGFARETGGLTDIGAFELQDEIFKNGFELP